MRKTYKSIAFSYPGSHNAEKLGFGKTGCWHIEITKLDIEGSGQCATYMPHDAEGFSAPDDPDLIALYRETQGEHSLSFVRYGNKRALKALGLFHLATPV